jgi:hypothetical protein
MPYKLQKLIKSNKEERCWFTMGIYHSNRRGAEKGSIEDVIKQLAMLSKKHTYRIVKDE